MRILLLQDVKKVGRRNEIKEVSDGYARNFLIVKKLAVPADRTAVQLRETLTDKEKRIAENHRKLAAGLAETVLIFEVKTGSKGEVFGSVKKEEVEKALQEKGFSDGKVLLEKPLKSLGEHAVEVRFGQASGTVKVILRG